MLGELGINKKEIIRYALLPQIVPRVRKLVRGGSNDLPYYILSAFNAVGIIPNNDPSLRPENHGRYSIFGAMAVAANHITFNRKNIDKIGIFAVILSGIVMMLMQVLLCILALFAAPAYAYSGPGPGPQSTNAFFNNPNTQEDLAFRLLDLIFGLPGIFNSKDMVTTHFHQGLHALFQFYSFGILLVGTFVIIYLSTRIVLETAQSGIPFGQRFNKAWAPIRLALFLGLLLPTTTGINTAQYLLLNAAKFGSNLATNAWINFDRTTSQAYLGNAAQLIARPAAPDLESLASFMVLARTCSWAEGRIEGLDVRPYIVFGPGIANAIDLQNSTPAFSTVVQRAEGGTVFVRFGEQDDQKYPHEKGAVFPHCGELALTIVDQAQPGAAMMQQAYIEIIGCLWSGRSGSTITCGQPSFNNHGRDYTARFSTVLPYNPFPSMGPYVGNNQRTQVLITLNSDFEAALTAAMQRQINDGDWTNNPARQYGWAGAGIWFNKIAQQNGAFVSAVFAKPIIRKMPYVMEYIKTAKLREDSNTPFEELYTPTLSSGRGIVFEIPAHRDVAVILNQVYRYWGSNNANAYFVNSPETHRQSLTGNIVIDVLNTFMGTKGLFDMCRNTDVHPLAQLASVGKTMIEHSISSFAVATGVGIGAGILALMQEHGLAQAVMPAASFFITFASIGLIVGFIMFYVLPFLPFIYFFFAVMTWVKGIFEAMVGMPLWALAHLRIDGEGMPGQQATSGYFHILEVFLRPICILIGFLGAIVIFTAMVKVLNTIFYLVISNVAGNHVSSMGAAGCFNPPGTPPGAGVTESMFKRGVIDEFFFTVIYTIIVYMLATPCFKLVDLIPDGIMRWIGSGITPFGAMDGDPAEGLMKYVSAGAGVLGGKLKSSGKSFGLKSID